MSGAAPLFNPPGPPEMTLEAWAELDEDEPGELVDGVLEEEEMPTFIHEAVVAWLFRILSNWAAERDAWVFGSEAKYAVRNRRGRKPDLSIYLPGVKLPSGSKSLGRTPPSIVVEVVSSRPRDARRDRVEKVGDYQAFGVPLYWIIEPSVRLFEALDLRGDKPVIVLSAADGVHPAPGCEGLSLDLDALWSKIEMLPEDEDGG